MSVEKNSVNKRSVWRTIMCECQSKKKKKKREQEVSVADNYADTFAVTWLVNFAFAGVI